jgi:hypothetical protein
VEPQNITSIDSIQSSFPRRARTFVSDELKEEVRATSPIAEIAADYIDLRRSGRTFVGLCPFHAERTPSFTVNPLRQSFRCFGCGASGDGFTFVAFVERTDFRGAVGRLALRAGIPIDAYSVPDQVAQSRRQARERLNSSALALIEAEQSALNEMRRDLHRRLEFGRNVAKRLGALNAGDPPRFPGEQDAAWEALRLAFDGLVRADTAYCIAALAAPKSRYVFALHPELRQQIVAAALETGFVADGRGFHFEVPA